MAEVFFPSCKILNACPKSSERLAAYIKSKFGVSPIGCCRQNYQKLTLQDTAIVICNNCAAIMEENAAVGRIVFVWELIDSDPDFVFPDYHGEDITIQDCWRAHDKRNVQNAVRSILRKMNFKVHEVSENYERTKYCGTTLLAPCPEASARLTPKRYVENARGIFRPMSEPDKKAWIKDYCSKIETEKVACYCTGCARGIREGGKEGLMLLDLLFAEA